MSASTIYSSPSHKVTASCENNQRTVVVKDRTKGSTRFNVNIRNDKNRYSNDKHFVEVKEVQAMQSALLTHNLKEDWNERRKRTRAKQVNKKRSAQNLIQNRLFDINTTQLRRSSHDTLGTRKKAHQLSVCTATLAKVSKNN